MSQSQHTYQTITTINVSQGSETPALSSPAQAPTAGPAPTQETEVVEDSLNAYAPVNGPLANAPAADVQQAAARDDLSDNGARAATVAVDANSVPDARVQREQSQHDDLYSLTPERPRTHPHQAPPDKADASRKTSNNALDALLKQGATVHKAVKPPACIGRPARIVEDNGDELQSSADSGGAPVGGKAPKSAAQTKRPSGKQGAQHAGGGSEEELQSFEDSVSAPVGSHQQSTKPKPKPSTTAKAVPSAASKKPASKPLPSNATGSLAALRQRGGQDAGSPTNISRPSALQPRDANVQTPTAVSRTDTKKVEAHPQASTRGKLQPVNKSLLGLTPLTNPSSQPRQQVRTAATKKENSALEPNDDSITVASGSKHSRQSGDSRGATKRATGTMKDANTDVLSTYDVPESSDNEKDEDYRPGKKATKSKAAQRRSAVASSSPAPSKKTALKSKAKASKQAHDSDDLADTAPSVPSKSTRSKMKAESGTAVPVDNTRKGGDATSSKKLPHKDDTGTGDHDLVDTYSVVDDTLPAPSLRTTDHRADLEHDEDTTNQQITMIKQEKPTSLTGALQHQHSLGHIRGASQQDAIELSDAPSSSDGEPSAGHDDRLPKAQASAGNLHSARLRPRTPGVLPSSPPAAAAPSTRPTTVGLIDPQSARKSTIISFDKSGPRNQGTTSRAAARQSLAQTGRSSIVSEATNTGSTAKLRARRQDSPSTASNNTKLPAREASAAPRNIAANAQEALASFKRKHGTRGRSIFTSDPAQDNPDFSRRKDPDERFANVDQYDDGTTLVGDWLPAPEAKAVCQPRTFSQLQMPPPARKGEPVTSSNKALTVPSVSRPGRQNDQQPLEKAEGSRVLGKRSQPVDPGSVERNSKRVRQQTNKAPPVEEEPTTMESMKEATVVRVTKPVLSGQIELVQRRANSQQQARRQRSQGTVDIHGSPVPDGMVIGGLDTVLETFSQQARIPSDQTDVDGRELTKALDAELPNIPPLKPVHRQTTRVSSNTKPLPAEPSQESQAITHVARVPAVQQPFVTTVKTAHPPTDPFTSSEERQHQDGKNSSTSAFSEYLKQKAANASTARKQAQRPALSAAAVDDDPDKTLVEEEYAERAPTHPGPKRKRIESFDSVSSSDMSADSDETDATMRDMGIWRTALQPHELNVFDSLVTIAHRLVRDMVDQSEASAHIVDDYRRRGEELVENLRIQREKDVREYYASLKEKKRRLQRELDEAGDRLETCSAEVAAARKVVREQVVAAKGRGEEGLKSVIEVYC